jgi:hypothetical protein
MKLLIATPAYDHKVYTHYAMSLAGTAMLLESQGIQTQAEFVMGDSLLVAARNKILQKFLDSDATHLLCIDSDIGWPPLAVLSMLRTKKEFIGGLYPQRYGSSESFVYRPSLDSNNKKILEGQYMKVDCMPAGFMLMERSVLKKMIKKFPNLKHQSKTDKNDHWYCFFDTELHDGEFWGEDFVFCRRARDAGVEIWVDTLIEFEHANLTGSVGRTPNGENPYKIKS